MDIYCGNFANTYIKSLGCTSETNTMWYGNYISRKLGKTKKRKLEKQSKEIEIVQEVAGA